MGKVVFISKSIEYQLNNKEDVTKWLNSVAESEDVRIEEIKYLFVNEKEITDINKNYLAHNYPTDIITFGSNFLGVLNGEIYICFSVVSENAIIYSNNEIYSELLRVIVHGLLHLIGYKDFTEREVEIMREKENIYLNNYFK